MSNKLKNNPRRSISFEKRKEMKMKKNTVLPCFRDKSSETGWYELGMKCKKKKRSQAFYQFWKKKYENAEKHCLAMFS